MLRWRPKYTLTLYTLYFLYTCRLFNLLNYRYPAPKYSLENSPGWCCKIAHSELKIQKPNTAATITRSVLLLIKRRMPCSAMFMLSNTTTQ